MLGKMQHESFKFAKHAGHALTGEGLMAAGGLLGGGDGDAAAGGGEGDDGVAGGGAEPCLQAHHLQAA